MASVSRYATEVLQYLAVVLRYETAIKRYVPHGFTSLAFVMAIYFPAKDILCKKFANLCNALSAMTLIKTLPSPPGGSGRQRKEVMRIMADAPKNIIKTTDAIKAAWLEYAADVSFGGMTEADYEKKVSASYSIRAEIKKHEEQIKQLITDRDLADKDTDKVNQIVIKGVVGNPDYGDDSDMYGACGYIRKSQRKSGLTRKKKTAAATATN